MTDLLSALWRASLQGGIVLLFLGLLALSTRRRFPTLTSWLWRLGLLRCALGIFLPFTSTALTLPEQAAPASLVVPQETVPLSPPISTAPQAVIPVSPEPAPTTFPVLPSLYVLGLTLCLARLTIAATRTRRLVQRAIPTKHPELPTLTAHFGLRGTPKLARSTEITSPLLAFGTILLPSEASDDEPLILAHELAHLKRHDLVWELVLSLIQAVFWFHPLVWWAKREESLAREQAADALAITHTKAPRADYARALLAASLQRSNGASLLAVGAITRGSRLRRRLNALAQPRLPYRQAVALGTLASVTALCAFVPWKAVAKQVTARSPLPARTIEGHVRRQDGQPIANAQVRLVRYMGSGFTRTEGKFVKTPSIAEVVAQTKTAADGTYRFPGTHSGSRLHLLIDAPGFAPTDRFASGGRITLEPILRWEAVVVDAQGRPLAGKKITAVGISEVRRTLNPKLYEGLTDSQGRFTVEGCERPGAKYTVLFALDAAPLVMAAMTPSQTENTLFQRLVMVPGKTLSGQITDTKGTPLPAVRVDICSYTPLHFPGNNGITGCRTDAQGYFQSPLLPPGNYQIDISSQDKTLAPLHLPKLTLGTQQSTNIKLTLTPGVTVRGKVTDAQTGKPIPNLLMSVTRTWDILKQGKLTPSGHSVSGGMYTTDAKGNYEVHLPADKECTVGIQLDDVSSGKPQISRRVPDQISRQILGKEGQVITVNFTPTYARPLIGQVEDTNGKPISGAQVNGFRSNNQGRFSIPEERLGLRGENTKITLVATKADLRSERTIESKPGKPVRLVLKPRQWITLRGKLVGPDGKLPLGAKLDVMGTGEPHPPVNLDATGNFTTRIEPGYRIQLQALAPGLGRVQKSLPDNLAPGTTQNLGRLVFPAAPNFIAGWVVDAQGKPVTRGRIGVFGKQTLATTTLDTQGRFELKGLVPGDKLVVSIQATPGKPSAHRWNVPHNRRDLIFRLGGNDPYMDRH